MEIWKDFLQVREDMIESTSVDFCVIRFGGSLGCKLPDNQKRLTKALVLLAPLVVLGSKSTSLSAGIHL